MPLTPGTDAMKRALFALVRRAHPTLDYYGRYRARVVRQSEDGRFVDVVPDDRRLPPMGSVPLRVGLPGARLKIDPGAGELHITVGWDNGDPQRPFAELFDHGSAATLAISLVAEKIELGGAGLIPALEQVVIGKTPCQFTGAPHAVMQPLSSRVFAKE